MRWNIPAGILMALAFLIPSAPAVAQTGSPGLNEACQTVERKVYKDIRELVTIDLDTASVTDVRVLAARILAAATANSLTTLPGRIQERLNGTADELRAFLKTNMQTVWSTDLRVAVNQTMTGAGANVKAAGQEVLDDGTIDAFLAYLNNGLHVARELDCASQPAPSASASTSPSPSVSASASVSPSAAAAGTLPTTGANTSFLVLGGVALFLFGIGVVLVARRFRT
jgi:LPXTG-motif cell wall-anchored protein